jgi:hypothetical protein
MSRAICSLGPRPANNRRKWACVSQSIDSCLSFVRPIRHASNKCTSQN